MLRRVPPQLPLIWRRLAPGPPVSTIASMWIPTNRDISTCTPGLAASYRSKGNKSKGSGCKPDHCRDVKKKHEPKKDACRELGRSKSKTLRPHCDKATHRSKQKVCPPFPPCEPPPCGHQGKCGQWCLCALLATLAALGGLYYFGILDPLLDMLGLACLRRSPGDFPGLGRPRKRRARHHHPASSEDLPRCVQYLVIGGGSAGIAAARAIRSADKSARVLIMAGENAFPYQRTPLSKELWQGGAGACFVAADGSLRSVFYEPESFFVDCKSLAKGACGVAVARGWEVHRLKPREHVAILHDGHSIQYEKCLLATGSTPYQISALESLKGEMSKRVMALHDVCDFETLRAALRGGARDIIVVGSSAQACELAVALARHGRDLNIPGLRITLVYPDDAPHARVLPVYLGRWLARRIEQEGVRVVPRAKVRGTTSKAGEHSEVRLSTGDRLPACRVVVMAAAVPNTDLARRSGLPVDCKRLGFKANSQMYVKDDIWAAGDCVSFCSPDCGRIRLDGLDHALASGRLAGQNMVVANKGKDEAPQNYNYMPVRWASLAPGASYEAVGEVDTHLATVGVFAPISERSRLATPPRAHSCDPGGLDDVDYSHGVVFYLRDNVVVGVLLWNLSRRIATARKIIDNMVTYDELDDAVRQLCLHAT